MAALAAADREGFVAWTQRGIDLAEEREGASYWLGPLLNNLGWEYYEAADYALALDAFERALRARERDPANASAIEIARYAVGKTLRALGRAQEAIPLLEQAVAWAEREGRPDGWFHEELAEEYAAVGRARARPRARAACNLAPRGPRPVVRGCSAAPRHDLHPWLKVRAGCSRACASAPARASRAPSRAPRPARASFVAAR